MKYNRNGGGRYRCNQGEHYVPYTTYTIFRNIRCPLNMSYRLIFHHFIENHDISGVSHELHLNWRTVKNHYQFCKKIIHEF